MAIRNDEIFKQGKESYTSEPIMVTITLAEYRSLIEENAQQQCNLGKAQDEIDRLQAENDRLIQRKFIGERNNEKT